MVSGWRGSGVEAVLGQRDDGVGVVRGLHLRRMYSMPPICRSALKYHRESSTNDDSTEHDSSIQYSNLLCRTGCLYSSQKALRRGCTAAAVQGLVAPIESILYYTHSGQRIGPQHGPEGRNEYSSIALRNVQSI